MPCFLNNFSSGWANKLEAGTSMKFKDFEILKIDIDLTDEGFRTIYWKNKHNHRK
jgi:secreted Zn-dependent insulinase-like peptidase